MTVAEKGLPAEGAPPEAAVAPRRKPTTFAGDVLKLVSGTTLAQAIGVLVTPLLTRLYAPEAFGTLALFTSITGIITVVACLRYELAMMLPETDEEAANLLAVSLLAVVGITVLTVPIVTLGRPLLVRLLNAPDLGPYLWLVPVAVFFGGAFQALNYWNSRTKHFGRLSMARVVNSVSAHVAKLAGGYAGHATGGTLIGSTVLGSALSAAELGRRIWHDDGIVFRRSIRMESMWYGVGRYRKFPLIDSWSALLNTVSWQLPALMLSFFFTATVVGHYALGLRVLQLPMSLVGGAIGQVFFQRAAEAQSQGQLRQAVESTIQRLFTVGLFPVLALAISGRSVFTFVFGPAWAEAGVYCQILAPWILFWFLSSPLSTVFSVLERQGFLLRLNVAILSTRFASLAIGGILGDARLGLALFAMSGVATYGYLVFSAARSADCDTRSLLSSTVRQAGDYLLLGLPLGAVLLGSPDGIVAALGAAACCLYFVRVIGRIPHLWNHITAIVPWRRA